MRRRPASQFVSIMAVAAMALSPIAATSAAAQQRTEVGNAASVVGNVTMQPNGTGDANVVARKQRFAWGDVITTAKKSQLQILLLDRSTYGVGARTQLRIDRFVYDPNEGRSSIITFIKGALRFFSGRNDGNNSGEVNTPAGRIGIRGTAVDMLVGRNAEKIAEKEEFVGKVDSNKNEATFVVLRGPGAQTLGGLTPGVVDVEGAGVTVTLNQPGLAAYIPRAGAAPIGPFRISNKGLSRVQDQHAPEVARANSGSFLNTLIPAALGAVALGVLISELDGGGDDDTGATSVDPNGNTSTDPYDPNNPRNN